MTFRLWIRRRDIDEENIELINECDQFVATLKHMDFIPQRLNGNTFESIEKVLERINERLHQPDASKWNMISLQSLKMEANSDWNIADCEDSLAEESSRHLIVLRLFYEELDLKDNEPLLDHVATIGIEDFKPHLLSGGSFFKRPQFEPFSCLVHRAARWLTDQPNVHFMNVQSIDIKVKSRK